MYYADFCGFDNNIFVVVVCGFGKWLTGNCDIIKRNYTKNVVVLEL